MIGSFGYPIPSHSLSHHGWQNDSAVIVKMKRMHFLDFKIPNADVVPFNWSSSFSIMATYV